MRGIAAPVIVRGARIGAIPAGGTGRRGRLLAAVIVIWIPHAGTEGVIVILRV